MVRFNRFYNYFYISYNEALKIDPKCSKTWNNKGLALYYLSNYSEAIEW